MIELDQLSQIVIFPEKHRISIVRSHQWASMITFDKVAEKNA